jgi:hypothetical protein
MTTALLPSHQFIYNISKIGYYPTEFPDMHGCTQRTDKKNHQFTGSDAGLIATFISLRYSGILGRKYV